MFDAFSIALLVLAAILIGLSKAGFGGGLGILSTPICIIALSRAGYSPMFAVGFVLPLLVFADAASLYHYWGRWNSANLRYLLPGVVAGVLIAVQGIDRFTPRQFNVTIGIISMLFVAFQVVKEKIFAAEGKFAPNHAVGIPCGIIAGITSTFANGAGPVISMFLIPQNMDKVTYVATNSLVFCCINWIKLLVFIPKKLITVETLKLDAFFILLIPLGVYLGVWLNKRIPERLFLKLVYTFTFLTGLHLALS